jgi:hypothetical protein
MSAKSILSKAMEHPNWSPEDTGTANLSKLSAAISWQGPFEGSFQPAAERSRPEGCSTADDDRSEQTRALSWAITQCAPMTKARGILCDRGVWRDLYGAAVPSKGGLKKYAIRRADGFFLKFV